MPLNILRNLRGSENVRGGNVIKEKERGRENVVIIIPPNLVVVAVLHPRLQVVLIIVVRIRLVDRIPIIILNTTITVTIMSFILTLMVVIVILVVHRHRHHHYHRPQTTLVDLAQVSLQVKEDHRHLNHCLIKGLHHNLHNGNCKANFLLDLSVHIPGREWVRLFFLELLQDLVVSWDLEVVAREV